MTSSRWCATWCRHPPDSPILGLLGAIFRVREARRNEIRSQPSVDSQHSETLGLVGPESPASLFEPIIPTFIVGCYRERLRVQPAFGALGCSRLKRCRL